MKKAQELAIYGLVVFIFVILINIIFWIFVVIPISNSERTTQKLLTSQKEEDPLPLIDLLKTEYKNKKVVEFVKEYVQENNTDNLAEALDHLLANITNCKFYINNKLIYSKGEIQEGSRITINLDWANITVVL